MLRKGYLTKSDKAVTQDHGRDQDEDQSQVEEQNKKRVKFCTLAILYSCNVFEIPPF